MPKWLCILLSLCFSTPAAWAQMSCPSGRVISANFPSCYDRDNPNELTVSCRHPSHGLDLQPASTTTIDVASNWVDGGSGLSYDQHCRANLQLQTNQVATYVDKVNELDRNRSFKTQYKYTCRYQLVTNQFIDKVSAYCVPESDRYPVVSGPQCLGEDQVAMLSDFQDDVYDYQAVQSYVASMGDQIQWSIQDRVDEQAALALCADCSDISAELGVKEKYRAQLNCLISLMSYDPLYSYANDDEKLVLKTMVSPLSRAVDLDPSLATDVSDSFVNNLTGYILENL